MCWCRCVGACVLVQVCWCRCDAVVVFLAAVPWHRAHVCRRCHRVLRLLPGSKELTNYGLLQKSDTPGKSFSIGNMNLRSIFCDSSTGQCSCQWSVFCVIGWCLPVFIYLVNGLVTCELPLVSACLHYVIYVIGQCWHH